jgi:hypothetical protein
VLPELLLSVSWQISTREANKLSFTSQELSKTQLWTIDFQLTNYRITKAYYITVSQNVYFVALKAF